MGRGGHLAERFEFTSKEFAKTLEGLSAEAWKTPCHDEQRCVNQVAYHVASGHAFTLGLAQGIAQDVQLPPFSPEMSATRNAQQATQTANATRQETLELHRKGVAEVAKGLRDLSDADLDKTTTFMSQTVRAQDIVEEWLIGHMTGHLNSIRPPA